MAKKRGKSVSVKKTPTKKAPNAVKPPQAKAAPKSAPRGRSGLAGPSKTPPVTRTASVTSRHPPPPTPRAAAQPSLLQRAERLRDDILRSKLSHPDPWTYTPKAHAFGDRAQRIVDDAAAGRDPRRALDALAAEVEGDRDYQEARRLL